LIDLVVDRYFGRNQNERRPPELWHFEAAMDVGRFGDNDNDNSHDSQRLPRQRAITGLVTKPLTTTKPLETKLL
jgi:hypothetical protein